MRLGSAKLGFSCVFGEAWTYEFWPTEFIESVKPSIEYLELYVLATAIVLWEKCLKNRRIIVFCDNKSIVDMVNNSSSLCRNCMVLIRLLTLQSIRCNNRFFARKNSFTRGIVANAKTLDILN